MSVRFRRSAKICKGIKVNFNKNSLGLSVGGKGYGYTINSKGRKTSHIGLPGTGLSVINTSLSNNNIQKTNETKSVEKAIHIYIDDEGNITYYYLDGTLITDPNIIREIVHSPFYKIEKEKLMIKRNQLISNKVDKYNESNEELINIYKQSPEKIFDKKEYLVKYNSLVEDKYEVRKFDVPMPTEENIKENLMNVAKNEIKGINLFKVNKLREEYVNNNFKETYNKVIDHWKKEKLKFEELENQMAKEKNNIYKNEFESQKNYFEKIINGDEEIVCNEIDNWINEIEMPIEFGINYEYSKEKQLLTIDLDLPEIENFPKQKAIQLANGNIKMKEKSQNELLSDYKKYVFGLAIFVSAHLFNFSPNIKKITISGYTQRRNNIGDIQDEYLYSIKFIRDLLKNLHYIDNDPFDTCMYFENRANSNMNNSLKSIEPYEE